MESNPIELNDLLMASWFRIGHVPLPWLLLGIGVGGLSIALLVLMSSRLGHARPVQKCVILSVYAHFLLLGFAYVFNLFQDPRPVGRGPGMKVTYIDTEDDQDQRSGSEPWEEAQPFESTDTTPIQPQQPVEIKIPDPTVSTRQIETDISDLPPPDFLLEPRPELRSLAESIPVLDSPMLEAQEEHDLQSTPTVDEQDSTADNRLDAATVDAASEETEVQSLAVVAADAAEGDLTAGSHDRTKATMASIGAAALASQSAKPVSQSSPSVAAQTVPDRYRARLGDDRLERVLAQGGSRETEQAVQDALAWFASAQNPRDGRWSTQAWGGGQETRDFSNVNMSPRGIHADTALTGLALLSFLGAGHTHLESPYRDNIEKGLQYLFSQQSASTGSLAGQAGPFVAMYCHGIATLAISEAYILTGDKRIRPHLDGAIHYTLTSQNRLTGGWRYTPGDTGDTSQFGWQLMSLISARSAGIEIPQQAWRGANRFLQQVSLGTHGGLACYNPAQKIPSPTMTAEALMCRLFLQGNANQAAIDEAANYVSQHGLGQAPTDLYYYYYATLALHQLQDHRWLNWNKTLTRKLVSSQHTESGNLKGSWDANTRWGRTGGRVYSTAMATLCLESYYRYLPFYKSQVKTANRGLAIPNRR